MRSYVAVFLFGGLAFCACNGSNPGAGGAGVTPNDDGGTVEGGSVDGSSDDAGPTGPTGATGPTGTPGVYDGGPPAVIGGVVDSGTTSSSGGDAGPGLEDAAPVSCGTPSGSYTGTCASCSVTANTLTCVCQNGAGGSVEASLDLCSCPIVTEISNSYGALTCCGAAGGSYTSSCTNCSLTGTTLSCTCENDSNMPEATTLNLCNCSQASQVSNTNGQLTCP